jgi:hypothetical protein
MVAGLRGEQLDSTERRLRARLHLYSPGGQLACELAKNPTVLLLNDTLFAHGGVLPKHGAARPFPPPLWPGRVWHPTVLLLNDTLFAHSGPRTRSQMTYGL